MKRVEQFFSQDDCCCPFGVFDFQQNCTFFSRKSGITSGKRKVQMRISSVSEGVDQCVLRTGMDLLVEQGSDPLLLVFQLWLLASGLVLNISKRLKEIRRFLSA